MRRNLSTSGQRTFFHLSCVCAVLFSACADPGLPTSPLPSLDAASERAEAGDAWTGPDSEDTPRSPDVDSAPDLERVDPGLIVTAIDPARGPSTGGLQVVVMGAGFIEGMEVFFGDLPVLDTFVLNAGAMLVTTPAHPPGLVDITVLHLDIEEGAPATLPMGYLYEADLLITAVEPAQGSVSGGEAITIRGGGFTEGAQFYIGEAAGHDQLLIDENTLEGRTPPHPAGLASVHVVTTEGVVALETAFLYREPPQIDAVVPVHGSALGGTQVLLSGQGLTADASVRFGAVEADILEASPDGATMRVLSPAGPQGTLADIVVETSIGSAVAGNAWGWLIEDQDPYVLTCTHIFPDAGSTEGGEAVQLACWGLQYDPTVTFNGVDADILSIDADAGLMTVRAPSGAPGSADVRISHDFAALTLQDAYTYITPSGLKLTGVSPSTGPSTGGTNLTLSGEGFSEETSVWVGGTLCETLPVDEGDTLVALTPPGPPGATSVEVRDGGEQSSLNNAFTYTDGTLDLVLITPHEFAQAGGTLLRVLGDGFDESTSLSIDGQACDVEAREGPTLLWVRSPPLPVGEHEVTVSTGGTSVTRSGLVRVFDPRTGSSGTWGGPLDGALNVTVYGTQGFGPIAGAFVYAGAPGGQALSGYTNGDGQVTLSAPWLQGPTDVTATGNGWSAYTIAEMDAKNVTLLLRSTTPAAGQPEPIEYPPDAMLYGQVLGLDKFVVPPAGSCDESLSVPDEDDCKACGSQSECSVATHDCVDLLEQGTRCLRRCDDHLDCLEGYVCAGFEDNLTRCMPSPGEKIARCGVSASSVFSQDIYPPETGWVTLGETFELPSTRLGELAIVCFGGYRSASGIFTPTALGVRRHVYATAGAIMEGLDVVLSFPLDNHAKLRVLEPPLWPTGTSPPAFTLSIDLGADGAIPMTRPAYGGADGVWRVPRQIGTLAGPLYDASYTLYARISADTDKGGPSAYALDRNVTSLVEPALPYLEGETWALEPSPLEEDLYGLWASPDGRATAVGEDGTLLFHNGHAWFAQSSGTHRTLRSVDGRHWEDQWAAGDEGIVLHWDGLAWSQVSAPEDTYHAVGTAAGQPLWFAGEVRLRRLDADGQWHVEGPPGLQGIRGLDVNEEGLVAAVGLGGRAYLRRPDGAWASLTTGITSTLNAVRIDPAGELVAVGDGGVVLSGSAVEDALTYVPLDTTLDLTAVTRSGDSVVIAGDAGYVARRLDGIWTQEPVPGYRSKVHAAMLYEDEERLRIVGSTSHVIGPFIGYPVLNGPVLDADTGALTLSWTALSGGPVHYTRLNISAEKYGPTFWTLIVGRGVNQVTLPNLSALAGVPGLGSGSRSLDLQRIRNHDFDIDAYMSREFSIYRRMSWATDRLEFYAP